MLLSFLRRPRALSYCLRNCRQMSVVEQQPSRIKYKYYPDAQGNFQVDVAQQPSNKDDLSVNAAGTLEFLEEPLGIPMDKGWGFPRFKFGDELGPDNRYRIVCKLGWGINSSIWLAHDKQEDKYIALKALKGYATNLVKRGILWELSALEQVSSRPPAPGSGSTHCISLLDHFTHPGQMQDGDHLCLITDLMGGDIKSLDRNQKVRPLPFPLAKRILLHVLRGIAHMHSCGVVHTDLKHDNILFDTGGLSKDDISAIVAADPPKLHPPEDSWECVVQTAVSQPLPLPSVNDAMNRGYFISDFGSAQSVSDLEVDEITSADLRAPESIIKGPWNEKVDIWAFGCLVFELIVCRKLFQHKAFEQHGLDENAGHLWQMMCLTGEWFQPKQLKASRDATVYFDYDCRLKSHPPNSKDPFDRCIRNYKVLEEPDVLMTAAFMQRCLRLDPDDRPTAEELLKDPFWDAITQ